MNFLKKNYKKIPSFIKNKYSLTAISIIIWLAFFDSHNWIKQYELKKEIKSLEKKKKFYENEIYKDSVALHQLSTNPKTQEKFAREKFFMKKDNEDIIVIIDEK
tara:strand:+ start:229 stop:540 length:312 start_codon:yes stop_codon:yes gene_type:complete